MQKGIALGNLTQSICLAPGEVTQVAVIDWRRTTTGTSEELTEQGETVTSDISSSARSTRCSGQSRKRPSVAAPQPPPLRPPFSPGWQ